MPELQLRTLQILETALGRRVYPGDAPDWLMRPGKAECGPLWRTVRLVYRRLTGGMELPDLMPARERRAVDGLIGGRGQAWRIVEVDESQHFNTYRALTLRYYPATAPVAFPRKQWIEASKAGRLISGGGWAAPKPPLFPMEGGRHRQRAFRDALADLLPTMHGYAPTLRLAYFELTPWIWERGATSRMQALLEKRLRDP